MRLSLRARLTAFCAFVVLVAVLGFGIDVWWLQGRLGMRRVDGTLARLTATVAGVIRNELDEDPGNRAGAAQEARRTVTTSGQAAAVFDDDGRPLAPEPDDPEWRTPPSFTGGPVAWTEQRAGGAWRLRAERRDIDGQSYVLVVGTSLRDVAIQQHEVLEAMWIALPLLFLFAGGGGLWLATAGLQPLQELARQTADITPGGTETLAHDEWPRELRRFAAAFNELLARLRRALHTQQQFMADASHELRTPVSVVRAAADVALQQDTRPEAEYREALAIVRDQSRRLTKLVDSMLVLARADAGGLPLRPVDLYLDEVVADCCRALRPVASERGVCIRIDEPGEVSFRGDEEMLRQLVQNVVQNAVQQTPRGESVSVDIADGSAVRITVRDRGLGIAPADRERIFERFVRLNTARGAGGAGLGLPIARWIAQAHGGTLELAESSASGSTFVITLPRTGRPAEP